MRTMDHKNQIGALKTIYPERPLVAVGAVVFHQNHVLLVKRAKPPSQGKWSIPGGVVNLGETLQEAAEREILEETGLFVKAGDPIFAFDVVEHDDDGRIRFHYVIVDLMAVYVRGDPHAGDDAKEVRWVSPEDLPLLDLSEKTRQFLADHFNHPENSSFQA